MDKNEVVNTRSTNTSIGMDMDWQTIVSYLVIREYELIFFTFI